MRGFGKPSRLIGLLCIAVTSAGCGFQGVNSLPLPGAVGSGSDASVYHLQFANIGTLESNSPVLIDDVVVGSVRRMTFSHWHIDVDVSVRPDVAVPANAVASVGQTSLLGSMHVALDPPVGQPPRGRLEPGATIGVGDTGTYPSTEQTLSALAAVVTGGGLGQIGDVIHDLAIALSGRQDDVRDLLTRLDTFVGTLDRQRDHVIASVGALNRLATTLADQRGAIADALQKIPPALDVLIRERPRITTALDRLRVFSNTATGLVDDTEADLVTNLQNLQPTLKALADVGNDLDTALAYTTVFPFGQDIIDRGVRGDYINFFGELDFTVPRLKRSLLLGTRWGDENATLVPALGEPYTQRYTHDPLGIPIAPPPPGGPLGAVPGFPPTPQLDADPPGAPILPVTPPPLGRRPTAASGGVRRTVRRAVGEPVGRWWLMLSRLVRVQLIVFAIASIVGVAVMVVGYVQAPTLLGVGRITVTLELPAAGGLYRFSNVTYRGVEVGKVIDVRAVDGRRVEATLSLAESPRIPAKLVARVRSVSAVGEQYVDLQPPREGPPYLQDGSGSRSIRRPSRNRSVRCSTGSTPWWAPSRRTGSGRCSMSRSPPSTARDTTSVPCWTRRRN